MRERAEHATGIAEKHAADATVAKAIRLLATSGE